MKAHVLSGVDRIETVAHLLEDRRVGLMTNPTGITHGLKSTIDVVAERFQLSALFAVEHGIRGDIQAGEHVDTHVDEATGVTVFSAYGKNARFNDEMLAAFDVLIFDIQDVGARFYTYMYSMAYAMQACARTGKSMIVLDRINPLGGVHRCGTILDPRFASFVGNFELPTRHGLTMGEIALYVKGYLGLNLDLTVVELEGWKRSMYLDDTDLPWVGPSPNCATLDAAFAYIATCVFEGTNVSEGRGTTLPFQVVGAPWLDGAALEKHMSAHGLAGVHFRRTSFVPTFSKHQGEVCRGVQLHVTDRETCNLFGAGMILLDEIRALSGDAFHFLTNDAQSSCHLDLLLGTDAYRTGAVTTAELVAQHQPRVDAFSSSPLVKLLYD